MIGTLRETSLHAALKQWYAQPGDLVEVEVGGYVIDLERGEALIEIQTRNFAAIRRKLAGIVWLPYTSPLLVLYGLLIAGIASI